MIKQTGYKKLYEIVVDEMGKRIMAGQYPPDEALPNEDALCLEYGVSRGVLREATKVLTQKGLIRARPKTGTRVLPRNKWNLFDSDVLVWKLRLEDKRQFLQSVTEVRRIIECESAKLAARRADKTEIRGIRSMLAEMISILDDESGYDYETYLSIDMAFHAEILSASHNEVLSQIGRTIREAVHEARLSDTRSIDILRQSLPCHKEISAAISNHDPDEAYSASRRMFDQVWEHIAGAG